MPARRESVRSDEEISACVREHMKGRSQRELAELLGVGASGVSRALAGKRSFNLQEIALIADWLGIESDDLLFREPGMLTLRGDDAAGEVDEATTVCRAIIGDFFAFRAAAE